MHILCTICSDLVNQAESLYVTKCGHIFHHQCLAQWIERSKTCPQCRNKVTERCMFRMYPTVPHEPEGGESAEDAAALRARLDDAALQLRTQRAAARDLEGRLATLTADFNNKESLLAAAETRLAAREAAAAALRTQLGYARDEARDTQRLRDENVRLQKNMQTLNGLQRVLNATTDEVEAMLRDYSDLRTVATFAAALKRALCDSEGKKREWRSRQLGAAQQLAAQRARADQLQAALSQVQNKMMDMERKYEALKHKRKASDDGGGGDGARASKVPRPPSPSSSSPSATAPSSPLASPPAPADSFREQSRLNDAIVSEENLSFGSMVARIEAAESPYLPLRRGGLALAALQLAPSAASAPAAPARGSSMSRSATSIFHQRAVPGLAAAPAPAEAPAAAAAAGDASYDGLGGHGRPDPFPARPARPPPRGFLPRVGVKHKLKKFDPSGSQNIAKMFGKLQDK